MTKGQAWLGAAAFFVACAAVRLVTKPWVDKWAAESSGELVYLIVLAAAVLAGLLWPRPGDPLPKRQVKLAVVLALGGLAAGLLLGMPSLRFARP